MLNLTAKERRLYDYLLDCAALGQEPTIGDICRDCRTTVHTLLSKTWPSLKAKMREAMVAHCAF